MLIEKLLMEQEELFEEQYKRVDEGLEKLTTYRRQDDSFEDYNKPKHYSNYKVPQGYKYQVAAQTIQKYLRGHIIRKFIKKELSQQKAQSNRYKRMNLQCEFCSEKFSNQNSLHKHRQFLHAHQPKEQVVSHFKENSLKENLRLNSQKQQDLSQMYVEDNKKSSVNNFKEKYAKEEEKGSNLTTPFRKLRLSKKQYQHWSDKIMNQYKTAFGELKFASEKSQQDISQEFNRVYEISSFSEQKSVSNYGLNKLGVFDQDQDMNHIKVRKDKVNTDAKRDESRMNSTPQIKNAGIVDAIGQDLQYTDHKMNSKSFSIPFMKDLSNAKKLQSAKKALNFTPKSYRLNQPMLYEFDIYIRAATEIQRHFRGFLTRKRILGSFKVYRLNVIKLQRAIRKFLYKNQIKYQKYLEFLQLKSKRIVHDLKNFYKIYSKFEKFKSKNQPSMSNHCHQADKHKDRLEKGYQQVRQKLYKFTQEKSIQTTANNEPPLMTPALQNYASIKHNDNEVEQQKDQLIMSLKSEVQALRLLIYRDITNSINLNSQTIEATQDQQFSQPSIEDTEYKSLQVLKERLANLQKTQSDDIFK